MRGKFVADKIIQDLSPELQFAICHIPVAELRLRLLEIENDKKKVDYFHVKKIESQALSKYGVDVKTGA